MANVTLPKANNPYTLGSTAEMSIAFATNDLNIPNNIDRSTHLDLTITNLQAGSLNNRVHTFDTTTRRLSKKQTESADMLARMGQNRDTERLASNYLQRQMPLTDKTNVLVNEKDALKKEMHELIKAQQEKLKNAFTNPQNLHVILGELRKAQIDIQKRIEKFDINSESLNDQLGNFTEELKKIMIAAGVSPDGTTPTYGSG
jgi:hypothetical protein